MSTRRTAPLPAHWCRRDTLMAVSLFVGMAALILVTWLAA